MLESAELRRRAYLDALGIDQYVSRGDLPGAAPTVRLALCQVTAPARVDRPPPAAGRVQRDSPMPDTLAAPARQSAKASAPEAPSPEPVHAAEQSEPGAPRERFSVAAIRAGGWLWLEDLEAMPLATEQVHLVRAMATALRGAAATSEVAQFNWPMHSNTQLDLGTAAAAASLGSFVQRQLEDGGCAGLVLLGERISQRMAAARLGSIRLVTTRSTREMLDQPGLKRQVWHDLKPHAGP